jgi:hypothetical protein
MAKAKHFENCTKIGVNKARRQKAFSLLNEICSGI